MRRPISRVRSVTETSITLAMPMAPTMSEMRATLPSITATVCVLCFAASCISARLRMSKSGVAPFWT